jgi:glycine betaine/choline ABC-type transport system substrate-binding protein
MFLNRKRIQSLKRCLRLNVVAAISLLSLLSLLLGQSAFAQTIRVGGKNFTEQVLIAELTGQLLKAKGYDVSIRIGLSSHGIRLEQEAGLLDIYWGIHWNGSGDFQQCGGASSAAGGVPARPRFGRTARPDLARPVQG